MHTGTKIKELRKRQHMTQEELGELLGVKKAAIQKYEKGEIINLKLATIKQLCTIFDVTPDVLIFPDGEMFDQKYDNEKLSREVKVIESIDELYGPEVVEIISVVTNLNDKAKNRIIEMCYDLHEIPKYAKVQDSSR